MSRILTRPDGVTEYNCDFVHGSSILEEAEMIIVVQCKTGDRNNCPPLSLVGNRAVLRVQPKMSICDGEGCADPGAFDVQHCCEALHVVLVKVDIGAVIR